jgi:hypothetical protein
MKHESFGPIDRVVRKLQADALKAFKSNVWRGDSSADRYPFRKIYAPSITVGMLSEAVRLADGNLRHLVSDVMSVVLSISTVPRSFIIVEEAALDHMASLRKEIESGRGMGLYPESLKDVRDEFSTMRSMLDRQLELYRPSFTEPKNKGGRPPEWDWEGAKAHVLVCLEKNPITLDRGAQAQVVEMIQEFFSKMKDREPDIKAIKEYAKKILEEYEA